MQYSKRKLSRLFQHPSIHLSNQYCSTPPPRPRVSGMSFIGPPAAAPDALLGAAQRLECADGDTTYTDGLWKHAFFLPPPSLPCFVSLSPGHCYTLYSPPDDTHSYSARLRMHIPLASNFSGMVENVIAHSYITIFPCSPLPPRPDTSTPSHSLLLSYITSHSLGLSYTRRFARNVL